MKKNKTDNRSSKELASLTSKIDGILLDVEKVAEKLKVLKEEKIQKLLDQEESNLKKRFDLVIIVLVSFISLTTLTIGLSSSLNVELVWVCISAGILGSAVAALISVLQRKANGWEFGCGLKYPSDYPKDKFSIRMSTFFMYRPLLGIMAGVIIFYGYKIVLNEDLEMDSLNKASLIFWSLLGGLFAKSLIEKLKQIFNNLIGV